MLIIYACIASKQRLHHIVNPIFGFTFRPIEHRSPIQSPILVDPHEAFKLVLPCSNFNAIKDVLSNSLNLKIHLPIKPRLIAVNGQQNLNHFVNESVPCAKLLLDIIPLGFIFSKLVLKSKFHFRSDVLLIAEISIIHSLVEYFIYGHFISFHLYAFNMASIKSASMLVCPSFDSVMKT